MAPCWTTGSTEDSTRLEKQAKYQASLKHRPSQGTGGSKEALAQGKEKELLSKDDFGPRS